MISGEASMKLGRLNHVGVATPDVEAAAQVYADLYGVTERTEASRTKKTEESR